jgi:hypothetical protein
MYKYKYRFGKNLYEKQVGLAQPIGKQEGKEVAQRGHQQCFLCTGRQIG